MVEWFQRSYKHDAMIKSKQGPVLVLGTKSEASDAAPKAYPKMVGSHGAFGIASGNKSYPTAVP